MDRLTRTVREQVALGRLLPLGGPEDAAWITERAAVRALRRAVAGLSGVRLGETALSLAEAGDAAAPRAALPFAPQADPSGARPSTLPAAPGAAPVGALPHVPVRIEAAFVAALTEPLPSAAERLREELWAAARDGLGIVVAAVDLRVTGLLEEDPGPAEEEPMNPEDPEDAEDAENPGPAREVGPSGDPMDPVGAEPALKIGPPVVQAASEAVEAAVRAVPGVLKLTHRLAGLGAGVGVHDVRPPQDPGRRVQVQIAVAPGYVPLTVARAVAAAAVAAGVAGAPGPVSVAVVVTDVVG
jgi:hypothetical protein